MVNTWFNTHGIRETGQNPSTFGLEEQHGYFTTSVSTLTNWTTATDTYFKVVDLSTGTPYGYWLLGGTFYYLKNTSDVSKITIYLGNYSAATGADSIYLNTLIYDVTNIPEISIKFPLFVMTPDNTSTFKMVVKMTYTTGTPQYKCNIQALKIL